MSPRHGRPADRGNWLPTAAVLRSLGRRRHQADARCAARDHGISPAPGAPTAPAGPQGVRQPTSNYIAAPFPTSVLASSHVIPGCPTGAGPESMNAGRCLNLRGQCSWIPGSRATRTPRNDGTIWSRCKLVLHQCGGGWAIFEALAAAGALHLLHLVEVPRFQQGRPDRRLRTHLAAETAGIADSVVDPH